MDFINKYVRIIEKSTNKCLAQGEIKFDKNSWGEITEVHSLPSNLISFDNIIFFHSIDYDGCPYTIQVEKSPLPYNSINFIEVDNIKKKFFRHLNLNTFYNFHIYIEKPIDKEIETLCNIVNSIPGLETASSCCGHNTQKAYLTIHIRNMIIGEKFINMLFNVTGELYNYWHSEFRHGYSVDLTKNIDYIEHMGVFIPITLVANSVGYEPINILAKEIQKYIDLGYFN